MRPRFALTALLPLLLAASGCSLPEAGEVSTTATPQRSASTRTSAAQAAATAETEQAVAEPARPLELPAAAASADRSSEPAAQAFVSKIKSRGKVINPDDLPPAVREQLLAAMAQAQEGGAANAAKLDGQWKGKPFPLSRLQTLHGEAIEIAGQRTLINFWATWCEPCIKEMPVLEALQKQEPDLRIITISNDMDRAELQRYLEQTGLQLPVVFDPERKIAEQLGVSVYPSSLLLAANSTVEKSLVGEFTTIEKLRARLGLRAM